MTYKEAHKIATSSNPLLSGCTTKTKSEYVETIIKALEENAVYVETIIKSLKENAVCKINLKKCIVIETPVAKDFENEVHKALECGYKIEASSCNSKLYKAILILENKDDETE